jgi:hypothetical protein
MKVIFLDHDGVICLSSEWGGRHKKQRRYGRKMSQSIMEMPVDVRFDNFNKKAIDVLNEILEETNCSIVVSSDWKRWASVEEMGEYYESQGIKIKPIGFTKSINDCEVPEDFSFSRQFDLEQQRHFEILQYLKDNPQITHWVAVDDLNMGKIQSNTWGDMELDWGLDNFVLTPRGSEGIKQSGIKEKIIEFLK